MHCSKAQCKQVVWSYNMEHHFTVHHSDQHCDVMISDSDKNAMRKIQINFFYYFLHICNTYMLNNSYRFTRICIFCSQTQLSFWLISASIFMNGAYECWVWSRGFRWGKSLEDGKVQRWGKRLLTANKLSADLRWWPI